MGYHQMINTCIRNADPDIRRDLYSGIILTGGNTLFAGFQNRLTKELTEISPQVRTHPSPFPFHSKLTLNTSALQNHRHQLPCREEIQRVDWRLHFGVFGNLPTGDY